MNSRRVVIPDSPYRGLESFDEEESDYFFGREQDTKTIGANLVTSRLTIFYGPSGVGKTSVLRAGVIPFVRSQPDVTAVLFRSWREKTFEWQLKQALAEQIRRRSDKIVDLHLPFDAYLSEASKVTRGTIVLVFDQFEEYMLYHPATSREGVVFDSGFSRAVNRHDLDANFLVAIREDAVTRLDRFRHAIPDMLGNRLHLEYLDTNGARDAIRKPLERYNEVVTEFGKPELQMNIEPELVDTVISQVPVRDISPLKQDENRGSINSQHQVQRVETPFLQMVMQMLWKAERAKGSPKLRLQTLRNLGNADRIAHDHVNDVMRRLLPEPRDVAFRIFNHMVTPSGSKVAYPERDLLGFAGKTKTQVPRLLRALSHPELRLLRAVEPAQSGGDVRYEIFHDILCDPILQWRAEYQAWHDFGANVRRALVFVVVIVGSLSFGAIQSTRSAIESEAKLRSDLAANTDEQQYQRTYVANLEDILGSRSGQKTVDELKARAFEATGTSYRQQHDLARALNAWNAARTLWVQAGDRESIARCDAAIDRIRQDIEWDEAYERIKHALSTEDLAKAPKEKCTLADFMGIWTDPNNAEWNLAISRDHDVTSITMECKKLGLSGELTREDITSAFSGWITSRRGLFREVTLPYPDGASACQRISGVGIQLQRKHL